MLLAGQAPVGAQATRTWVSGGGNDASPCSRSAPCQTFAVAISKTAAGGEINAIDAGGFGAVTIVKSISIVSEGVVAGVLAAGTNGIIVNAGPNDIVTLRGLDIQGAGSGFNGIRYLAGGALHVEDSIIDGFRTGAGRGIDVQATTAGELYLQNVDIRNNSGSGAFLKSTNGANLLKVTINTSRIDNNAVGIDARDHARVAIRDSVVSGNTGAGIQGVLDTAGTTTVISVESTVASGNGTGIQAGNGTGAATIRLANVTVFGNTTGLGIDPSSVIYSFGNNAIAGNTTDGAPTSTIPLR